LSKKGKTGLNTFKRLFGYISRYWELKVILVLILFTTTSTTLAPAIIGNIIDIIRTAAENNPIEPGQGVAGISYRLFAPIVNWVESSQGMAVNRAFLLVFSLALVIIAVIEGAMNYIQRYLLEIISQRAGFDMRDDMYNSLLEQSFSFYDHQRTGQLMARATGDINMLGRFFNMAFRMAISNSLILIMVLYSMFSLSPELSVIALVTVPFLMFATTTYGGKIRPMWGEVREQNGVITSVLQENLSGLRVVRGFSREDYEEEKFAAEVLKFFDINVTMAKIRAFFMPLASLISSVGIVIIIWYGGNNVINGSLSLGTVLAFYFYMARLMGPVRMLGFMTSMFVRAQAAADRVFEIIDAEIDVHDKDDASEFKTVEGHLVFEDVWFSYDSKNMVLKDIDLVVKPGQTVAILGATGSGKSSIINLIPRFYDVSKGNIKLDGVDIRDLTIKNLRSHIGIVRQDPYIFSSTLRENIAYGVEGASSKNVEEAAKQAKIHEFIVNLPDGYDTRVGERGVTLSGGQKQRVAIARALVKNPKILILDDSTSSVDTQTEYEIQQALDELLENRTTFIITQRLSSIKKADYIIVLEDGAIAEEGDHEKLMELNGIYRQLYDTQISGARGGAF
jgi:ABC-type multidrug transport system fused ATPase/permease subunit